MLLLPDDDNLEQHIKCANFLPYIQCHPDLRRHFSPIYRRWLGIGEWPMQTSAPHKTCPSEFASSFTNTTGSVAITLTPRAIQKLKMKLHSILTLIVNHQLSWSHLTNIKYLCIVLYIEPAYCLLIIY